MEQRYRSRRAELADLRAELRAKGASVRQIASVIRTRYRINSRVAYRYAHGLTQQQVADRWNQLWPTDNGEPAITHKHLSYWEAWPMASGRAPSPEVLNRLARVYRTSAAELLDGEDHTQVEAGGLPPYPEPIAGDMTEDVTRVESSDTLTRVNTLLVQAGDLSTIKESDHHELVRDLVEWACRMKRRDILQWLSWAAAAAAAASVVDGLDEQEQARVAQALVAPSRVDGTVVGHIEAVLWRCMRQDDTLGPQAALDTVLAQRGLVRSLLPEVTSTMRQRLLSLYANISRFGGWLSFDLGDFVAAGEYYETARAAAHEAQNAELGALVLCNLSHLASWRLQPRIGIDHAVAAQGWANRTGDTRLQAYAFDVAARAYAMDGQDQAAGRALEQARAALATTASGPDTHVYFCDAGLLTSTESLCHLYLDRPVRGIETAQRALATIDGSFVRNVALTSLRLGICHLRAAQPDVASAALAIGEAARLAAHNRSARLMDSLRRGWRELEPWQDVPEVKVVHDQLLAYGLA